MSPRPVLRLALACLALHAAPAVLVAQAATPTHVAGTEVFLTMDADAAAPFTCDWMNFVFSDYYGNLETLDFVQTGNVISNPNSVYLVFVGLGVWGPIFTEGNFLFEPFWLSQAFGNHGGFNHFNLLAVPSPLVQSGFIYYPYEEHPGLASGHRLGLRFARLDGAPFIFKSLDHRGADVDFQIGTHLVTYPDFAAFQRFTPVLNTPGFVTLTLPPPPLEVDTVGLDTDPGAGLVSFNPSSGTLAAASVVTSVRRADGSIVASGAADPLVSGIATLSAQYTGTDTTGLSDIVLTQATLTFTSTTGEVFGMTAPFAPGATSWHLRGPLGAVPVLERVFAQGAVALRTHVGGGSSTLASLAFYTGVKLYHVQLAIGPTGPRLSTLDRLALPNVGVTHAFATGGTGNLHVGIINLAPSTEVYHFLDINPAGALGSGPFFGIGFGPDQFVQTTLPLGLHPFHVLGGPDGTYSWRLPPGSAPAGILVDVVLIERFGSLLVPHPPVRVAF